jgi:hypothetical protein
MKIREDGTGYTGNWVIDPEKDFQKVVVYLRNEEARESRNQILIGDRVSIEGPFESNRYRIL